MELHQRLKKIRFLTCTNTFFMWIGSAEEEEEKKEEDEVEEDET